MAAEDSGVERVVPSYPGSKQSLDELWGGLSIDIPRDSLTFAKMHEAYAGNLAERRERPFSYSQAEFEAEVSQRSANYTKSMLRKIIEASQGEGSPEAELKINFFAAEQPVVDMAFDIVEAFFSDPQQGLGYKTIRESGTNTVRNDEEIEHADPRLYRRLLVRLNQAPPYVRKGPRMIDLLRQERAKPSQQDDYENPFVGPLRPVPTVDLSSDKTDK
jgi:hypothetical protein